jgi:hypothetical protein
MSEESRQMPRQIRCCRCHSPFWLRYRSRDPLPIAAATVICPHAECKGLNRIDLPAGAHAFELCEEADPVGPHDERADIRAPWMSPSRGRDRFGQT